MSKNTTSGLLPSFERSTLVVIESVQSIEGGKGITPGRVDCLGSREQQPAHENRDSQINVPEGRSPQSTNTQKKGNRAHRKWKSFLLRIIVWFIALAYATLAHIYFASLPGTIDTSQEAILQYAQRGSEHTSVVVSYLVVITMITSICSMATAVYVYRHYKEPRLRILFPPFLLHLCLASILVPPISLARQLYGLYYLRLEQFTGLLIFAQIVQATAMGMVLYAPLARLCVMHAIFVRGYYEIQYGWVLMRIVLQNLLFNLCYLAILGPSSVHWIKNVGWRIGIVCVAVEMLYYIVRLRNTRYARENYTHLLYIACFGFLILLCIGTILPLSAAVSTSIDKFNMIILMLWYMNLEILGPPLWYVFRNHMDWNSWGSESQVSLTSSDKIRYALSHPSLSAVLVRCAQQRFCEESIRFLQEGYTLQNALGEHNAEGWSLNTTLRCQMQSFLECYVIKGAKMPVNLASALITKFRRIHTILASSENCDIRTVELFETTLRQSLREVSELISSSGVLTRYDNSPERKEIESEMEAVKRLENLI